MTQASATVLLYAQAIALLAQMQSSLDSGDLKNIDDISAELKNLLSQYELTAGVPILQFEPVADGEPPLSAKINRTYTAAQYDINILQNQVDLLKAAAIFTHNVIKTDVVKAGYLNDKVNNKMKTLQLFTGGVDSNTFTFGDDFNNNQFVDTTFSTPDLQPSLQDGFLLLGQQNQLVNLTQAAVVSILPSSNGFAGNNQEIEDPTNAPVDPVSGKTIYTFVAEINHAEKTTALLDAQANTWFEYEHYLVSPQNKATANNLNFTYQQIDNSVDNTIGVASDQVTQIDWSNGPSGGVLELDLQFDLGALQRLNYIRYSPYGLDQNKNYPILINEITTSTDGTSWVPASPRPLWVGTATNLNTARSADDVTIGDAVWSFQVRSAQFIRIKIQQPRPINCNIGHQYYIDNRTGQRVQGPVPPITNPALYYSANSATSGSMIQAREYFVGKRWAIGISDFLAQQVEYTPYSVYTTKPINVGGVVDRLSISAEIYIPPSFPSNHNYVEFFVSPDNGSNWYQISRIQDNFLGIPEIIAFNDPLPAEFHDTGVAYFSTDKPVTSLRFQIQLFGLTTDPASSPIVRSYQLNVRLR